jgi:predicted O-linked N-acetylglucosamine transferase (SPINDLY family)
MAREQNYWARMSAELPQTNQSKSIWVITHDPAFESARDLYIKGKFQESEAALRQILTHQAQHAPALLLLSILARQFNFKPEALAIAQQAADAAGPHDEISLHIADIADDLGNHQLALNQKLMATCLNPSVAQGWFKLALSISRLGAVHSAERQSNRAHYLGFSDASMWARLAESQHATGAVRHASELCALILVLQPESISVLSFIGLRLLESALYHSAQTWLRQAAYINPSASSYNYYGITCLMLGDHKQAIQLFNIVVQLDPSDEHGHNNLSNALAATDRLEEANESARRAIALAPSSPDCYVNLANAFYLDNEITKSLPSCRRSLRLNPNYSAGRLNLGNYLADAGSFDESFHVLTEAICLEPGNAVAYVSMARALQNFGSIERSLGCYEYSVTLNPNSLAASQSQLLALQYSSRSAADIFNLHVRNMRRTFPRPADRPLAPHHDVLRIGFASGDFRVHPGGFFFAPLIKNLAGLSVETYCYSSNATIDDLGQEIKAAAMHWRPVANLKTEEVVARIKADALDILIDLSGHTQGNMLTVFAERPAPVQASWLGYFDTTGCQFIDYVIMDPVMASVEQRRYFTEEVLLLKHGRLCYQPPDYLPSGQGLDATIPGRDRPVTFGSFNNLAKLSEATVEAWTEILRRVPDSRLVLKWLTLQEPAQQDWLAARFEHFGISRSRLELRGKSPHAQMLAEYNAIDIALDPFPFNGGLTTAEALAMGVPVVTLKGERPIGRQGASLLTSANCKDLIATTTQGYIDLCVKLASQPMQLPAWRHRIAERLETSPLLNGPKFASQFLELCISAVRAKSGTSLSEQSN